LRFATRSSTEASLAIADLEAMAGSPPGPFNPLRGMTNVALRDAIID
jgi:hypothetical protein